MVKNLGGHEILLHNITEAEALPIHHSIILIILKLNKYTKFRGALGIFGRAEPSKDPSLFTSMNLVVCIQVKQLQN